MLVHSRNQSPLVPFQGLKCRMYTARLVETVRWNGGAAEKTRVTAYTNVEM